MPLRGFTGRRPTKELADGRFAWNPPDAAEPLDVDVVRLFGLAQPPRDEE